jgi:hypothetical protein
MWTTSVIFNKLLKVIIYPLSENSPNLVTLSVIRTLQNSEAIAQILHCPRSVVVSKKKSEPKSPAKLGKTVFRNL